MGPGVGEAGDGVRVEEHLATHIERTADEVGAQHGVESPALLGEQEIVHVLLGVDAGREGLDIRTAHRAKPTPQLPITSEVAPLLAEGSKASSQVAWPS